MRKERHRYLTGLACLLLLSCSEEQQGPGSPPQRETPAPQLAEQHVPPPPPLVPPPATVVVEGRKAGAPAIPDACRYDDLAESLATAKEKWQGTGINSYSMTVQRASFHQLSAWPNSTPLKLKVLSGKPSGNLKRVDANWLQSVTVDGLFLFIEIEAAKKPDCMKVEFDPMFGYPTTIRIDPEFGGTDDEVEYSVTEFGP